MDPVRILIVDDEEDLITTMAERLELRGFQVDTATTGAGALELVAASAYSVLILDVKMPGISGLELMTRIKEQQPDLPVILSAYNAGPSRAQRWRQYPEARDMPLFVERIPFTETRGYVKNVLANRAIYAWLYGEVHTSQERVPHG